MTITNETESTRVRWVPDEDYQTRGSYWMGTDEETKKVEDWELERLENGTFVALGAVVEHLCPTCKEWHETENSLWGIVIEPDETKLAEFAEHSLDIS